METIRFESFCGEDVALFFKEGVQGWLDRNRQILYHEFMSDLANKDATPVFSMSFDAWDALVTNYMSEIIRKVYIGYSERVSPWYEGGKPFSCEVRRDSSAVTSIDFDTEVALSGMPVQIPSLTLVFPRTSETSFREIKSGGFSFTDDDVAELSDFISEFLDRHAEIIVKAA